MIFSELGRVIEQIGKDRGIERDLVIKAIEQAFLVTARKKYGIQGEYETKYNPKDDDVEIFQYKNVVDHVRDPIVEIELSSAKKLDPEVEVGDQLGIKIENPNFSRVDVQTARQIILQKVRDAEKDILFAEFKHKEGQIVTGIARRYEKGNWIVDLGKSDAVLAKREIIPGENYKPGDRIQAYLSEVVMSNRGPEIRLSRTSPLLLVKLFENEVPEIQAGSIEIKSAAREPGSRAKMAVRSVDKDIDPVGACVGMKGSRVQSIVNELQGEKIDVVRWDDDIAVFARSSLAPAEITNIMVDKDDRSMDVVVEDDQLSLAIGKRGQNVRLAAMLTGFKINIISKNKLQEKIKKATVHLQQVDCLSEAKANVLVQRGFMNIADLAAADAHDVSRFISVSVTEAENILKEVKEGIEQNKYTLTLESEEDLVSATAVPAYHGLIDQRTGTLASKAHASTDDKDKFSDAERRLREELAAFKLK